MKSYTKTAKNQKYPKISVIMINYNGVQYLRRTIPALLKLSYPSYEILIVDNSSTDGSYKYLSRTKRIKVLRNPAKRSKTAGGNMGARKSSGSFLLFLDNDALITNSHLLHDLLKMYVSAPKIGCIGLSFVDEGKTTTKSYGNPMGHYFIHESNPLPLDKIIGKNGKFIAFPEGKGFFIAANTWKEVGGYDEFLPFYGEDSDLGIRLWLYGYHNLLYSQTIQTHIGLIERADNQKYALKLQDMIVGHFFSITKNYSDLNMLITLIGFSFFSLLKTTKLVVIRRYPPFIASYIKGHWLFLKNLSTAMQKRKEVQLKRVVSEDAFLYLP